MAKTVAPTAAEESAQKPKKKKPWIVMIFIGVVALGSGAAVPFLTRMNASASTPEAEGGNPKLDPKRALIPFDSVVVNVADGRFTRYLRVKITLVVDVKDEATVKEAVESQKPFLQTWVIGFLQDRTMEQLHGSAGMNRVRREVRDEFNRHLYPEGPERIKDILLPEYNFQ